MSNFTPGPWVIAKEYTTPSGYVVHDYVGAFPVAYVYINNKFMKEECAFNARLIAAAPEMHLKLEQAASLLHDASTMDWPGAQASREIANRIDALLHRIEVEEAPK